MAFLYLTAALQVLYLRFDIEDIVESIVEVSLLHNLGQRTKDFSES